MEPPAQSPSQPVEAVEAEEGEDEGAASIGIWIVPVTLLIGIAIGFIIGARAAQIHMKLTQVGKAVMSLHTLMKIKEAAAGMEDAKAMDGDEDEDGEKNKPDPEELLEGFLETSEVNGLEDHPDIDINPVIMHHIKVAKEEQRRQQQRELMAADGMTEDEIELRMQMNADGPGLGDGKPNALSVLIAAGARVESTTGATNEEAQKKQDIRRKQRNIAVHLQKNFGIETRVEKAREYQKGKRSAYQVAVDTKIKPVGGPKLVRETEQIPRAKKARARYKEKKKEIDAMVKQNMKLHGPPKDPADEKAAQEAREAKRRSRQGEAGVGLDAAAIADLQAYADRPSLMSADEDEGGDDNDDDYDEDDEMFDMEGEADEVYDDDAEDLNA